MLISCSACIDVCDKFSSVFRSNRIRAQGWSSFHRRENLVSKSSMQEANHHRQWLLFSAANTAMKLAPYTAEVKVD